MKYKKFFRNRNFFVEINGQLCYSTFINVGAGLRVGAPPKRGGV